MPNHARRAPARALTIGATSLALLVAPALAIAAPATAAPTQPSPTSASLRPGGTEVKVAPSGDRLGTRDRTLLADARQAGRKRVTVMLATTPGGTEAVVDSLRAQGAWVGTVQDRLGYVRASVPTSRVEKVAALRTVQAADLDRRLPVEDPPAATAPAPGSVQSKAPDRTTPDANPYLPTQDTGSTAFKKKHPTYDGRGVRIGIVDSGVDLDHPVLQKTSTGDRKIVDWVTGTDPLLDGDPTWRPMLTDATGPSFAIGGTTYTAPAGSYKVSTFSEAITKGSEPAGDVNRDGDTTDVFGVLYDATTHDIWVDSDQDHTFATSEKMRPYGEKFQVGHFGTDDPATDVVERSPFVVEYREDVDLAPAGRTGTADFVNIGIVEDAHATHVAGIAAGHALFGGAMDGQAPGATIVSSRACTWGGGCTDAALLDGMVDVVVNRKVDVVNMSIGGLDPLNDSNSARSRVYDRLVNDYGVQLFISAGNEGPGTNTVGDPSTASDVVSVASSITKDTWRVNYGSVVSRANDLHPFSSRGPAEDGDLKPDLAAPGSAISAVPMWLKQPDLPDTGYTLPIGYAMFNGTSMASPQAAGAGAVLLSGTYARGQAVTTRQLRDALYSSANRISGVPSTGQGVGEVDVPGAFDLLVGAKGKAAQWTTDAPVCTPLSDGLATPDRGTGVYNRCAPGQGGQSVGKTVTYPVTVTKVSGSGRARRHTVRLVGNDGTFSAPTSVSAARGNPSRITVKSTTRSAGVHSAILEVDDPTTSVVDHRVLLTVVQADTLASPSYAKTYSSSVQRNNTKSVFVTVPEGSKTLSVALGQVATKSQTRFIAIDPYGIPIDSTASADCFTNYRSATSKTCNPTARSYSDPTPGIWEIEVESRRTSPFLDNSFALTTALQGVTIDPEEQTVAASAAGTPVSWDVTNDYGTTQVTAKGGPLGSARSARPTIASRQTSTYQVTVPEGAATFQASIGKPSDLEADLDLVVKDAAGATVATSADGDSEEAVSIARPKAGTYTIEVVGYSVPAGTTTYDYLDTYTSSSLGTLQVASGSARLAQGDSVTVDGLFSARGTAGEGRSLVGTLSIQTETGAVLGTATVLTKAVAAQRDQ